MEKFKTLTAVAAPLPMINVDTDMIIPKQFLKTIKRTGLGKALFHEMRTNADGSDNPEFVLNKLQFQNPGILVTGHNFGAGSSREAAVYALVDYGIRCVVATSFGDIFAGNAVNNGLVAAIVSEDDIEKLLSAVEQTGRAEVDLEALTIKAGNYVMPFTIDPARRTRLLNGWDDLDLTATYKDRIAAFAAKDKAARPWAVPRA